MLTLATGRNKSTSGQCGFSLVELLVVIAIVGLLSAVAVLTVPLPGGAARDEALRFAARAQVAAQESIISGKPIGLSVDDEAYRFYRFRTGKWQPIEGYASLATVRWDEDLSITVQPQMPAPDPATDAQQQKPNAPGIIFSPIGVVTPFRVAVASGPQRYVVATTPQGAITLDEQRDAQR